MKSLLCIAALVGICGVSEGMFGSDTSLDSQIGQVQKQIAPLLPEVPPFDVTAFKEKLNPDVSAKAQSLLHEALQEGDEGLGTLSEQIHCGLLTNKPIFKGTVAIEERDEYIYEISMKILQDSLTGTLPLEASIVALRNLFMYCKDKLGKQVLGFRSTISGIFLQMQYMESLNAQQ